MPGLVTSQMLWTKEKLISKVVISKVISKAVGN